MGNCFSTNLAGDAPVEGLTGSPTAGTQAAEKPAVPAGSKLPDGCACKKQTRMEVRLVVKDTWLPCQLTIAGLKVVPHGRSRGHQA